MVLYDGLNSTSDTFVTGAFAHLFRPISLCSTHPRSRDCGKPCFYGYETEVVWSVQCCVAPAFLAINVPAVKLGHF